jgi:hypothetical protein
VDGTEVCGPEDESLDVTCDALDGDCDGSVDEDYVPYTCGSGVCTSTSVCTAGSETCTPGSPTGPDTDCDLIDEDCDGTSDEDYVSYTCGLGVCTRDSTCTSGTESCTAGSPTGGDTNCNGLDEDCDGSSDEHYISYTCGLGVCTRSSSCISGSESCTPGTPTGETCNGLDDNCNGTPDDGSATVLCGSVLHGTPACTSGSCVISSCDTGWYDIDGIFSSGCECARDTYEPAGGSCTSAFNLGTLTDYPGTYITVNANIIPSGDVDWYRVTVTDDSDTTGDEFEFEVVFTSNPGGALRFDVYRGSCSSLHCSGVNDCMNWYTDFRGSVSGEIRGENPCRTYSAPGYNRCTNNGTTYYIRVYRASGSTTCVNYSLRLSNNRPSGVSSCLHV